MNHIDNYLLPGKVIDSNDKTVIDYTMAIIGKENLSNTEKAIKLYYYIRDDIRYDPYLPFDKEEYFRSSNVIKTKKGFCIHKAGLLCAALRVVGIPARVGFAKVKNHIATKQLLEHLGSNIVTPHGYTEIWLNEKWVKATPAFNKELCKYFKVEPLDFDGYNDSIMQSFNSEKKEFMEYLSYYGEFSDIDVNFVVSAMEETYGKERVDSWTKEYSLKNGNIGRDFSKEDII